MRREPRSRLLRSRQNTAYFSIFRERSKLYLQCRLPSGAQRARTEVMVGMRQNVEHTGQARILSSIHQPEHCRPASPLHFPHSRITIFIPVTAGCYTEAWFPCSFTRE